MPLYNTTIQPPPFLHRPVDILISHAFTIPRVQRSDGWLRAQNAPTALLFLDFPAHTTSIFSSLFVVGTGGMRCFSWRMLELWSSKRGSVHTAPIIPEAGKRMVNVCMVYDTRKRKGRVSAEESPTAHTAQTRHCILHGEPAQCKDVLGGVSFCFLCMDLVSCGEG